MSIARQLAERITSASLEKLPPEAVYWSKIALLDTVGVALAGTVEEPPRILLAALELEDCRGPSLIWGTNQRTPCLDAALINATAAHALDFDNSHNTSAGHNSAPMIPALIAAAEAYDASGRDVLLAHVVGFEVGARLGLGLNPYHHAKGWHPTSTFGVFAVAAACARLMGLSVAQTENALAICTSLASGTKANFGTMTKPLHVGECARRGLLAALVARRGFTAKPESLEHKYGFFNIYGDPDKYSTEKILERWAAPWDIVKPGAAYKQYACCGGTHPAIDVCLKIVQQHGRLQPGQIAQVDSWIAPSRIVNVNRPAPNSTEDARFSMQYCLARALVDGNVLSQHFEGDAYLDPIIHSLLPRTTVKPFADGQFPEGMPYGAEVRVTLADGKVLAGRIERPLGRTTDNPIPLEQLQTKFKDCSRKILPQPIIARALGIIDRFEHVGSVTELTSCLDPTGFGAARTGSQPKRNRSTVSE